MTDAAGPGTRSGCPKCGFASYGARYVHGSKAYLYARTQEPWMARRVIALKMELRDEILTTCPAAKEHHDRQMMLGHSLSLND